MENRLARLEARLEAVEKELKELRGKTQLEPPKPKTVGLSPDEGSILDACAHTSENNEAIRITELRALLGWDSTRFDDALDLLAKNGRVLLRESEGSGLSLTQMADAFLDDNGRSYTEISLV